MVAIHLGSSDWRTLTHARPVTPIGSEPDEATPLDPDELADLLPSHITSRSELNAWEQANIANATNWAGRNRKVSELLTLEFLNELHRRMFDDTWAWAGRYRRTGKSIGVPAETIPQALRDLLDDVAYWIERQSYDADEIGVRLHHRLVSVHPFPNGNGRHSRLVTDLLVNQLDAEPFTWGQGSLDDVGELRSRYIAALRKADAGEYSQLLHFVRSRPR